MGWLGAAASGCQHEPLRSVAPLWVLVLVLAAGVGVGGGCCNGDLVAAQVGVDKPSHHVSELCASTNA